MAQEVREFAVLVPAGTAVTAPLVTPIIFPDRIVTAISWRVPPGPSGKMGWQLTSAGAPVIPIQPKTYIVTDNQADTWPLAGYLDSGNWSVTAYNTGVYPHTVYLTFLLDLIGTVEPASQQPSDGGLSVVGITGSVSPPATGSPPPPPAPPIPDEVAAAVIAAVLAAASMS